MKTTTYFVAIVQRGNTWTVATQKKYEDEKGAVMGDIKPIGDCRSFDNFESADRCAGEFAAGLHWLPSGKYVNMR